MKKILFIIIFSLTTSLLSGCNLSKNEERKLNNEEWLEDIKTLDTNLKKEHPNIFRYTSEKEWNKNIENLKSDIDKLSDRSIILRISQIITSIGDAHTGIFPLDLLTPIGEEQIKPESIVEFPIKCEYFDDGVRVIECDSKYEKILGSKLISINNVAVNKILNDIATLIPQDYKNNQCALFYAKEMMNFYEFLKYFKVIDNNKSKYTFETNSKEKITLELTAKENKHINYLALDKKVMKTNKVPEGENEAYWYKNFKEDKILYFRLNQFTSNYAIFETKEEESKYPDIDEVQERLLNEINKGEYSKFIIDLRKNGGGLVNIRDSIVDMIKFRTDLIDEEIYILTGKYSNSASTTFAWELQKKLGANIVGETTGGNVNLFTTGGQIIELPTSKLKVYVSAYESVNEKGYIGGVNPDFEVKQNYNDYINGIDTVYEYIKDLNIHK